MLAKLKVVSVLESLPGVGKVQARRLMEELDISESRRLRGLGATSASGCSTAPKIVPRAASIWQFVLAVIAGPSGVGKGTDRPRAARAGPRLVVLGVGDTRAPAARARSTASTTASSARTSSRRCATQRRLPRVVRGLRPLKGTPRAPGRGSTWPPARTCCSRSTSRARWRSGRVSRRACSCS